jgi:hypothetical protein
MYGPKRPLHPASVFGYFQQNDARLTPTQLAGVLQQPVTEIAVFGIRLGADGKIGRHEVAFLEALALASL